MINLSTEVLKDLEEKTNAFNAQADLASEKLRAVQDQFGNNEVEIEREGKKIKIKQRVLWGEVFRHPMGAACQAGIELKKIYPDVFEAYEKQAKMAEELSQWCMKNLMFDYREMGIWNLIQLIGAMIDFKSKK